MAVSVTIFLGFFFQLTQVFVILIVLGFCIRIIGVPMRLMWDIIRSMV